MNLKRQLTLFECSNNATEVSVVSIDIRVMKQKEMAIVCGCINFIHKEKHSNF